jgi:hypothetical protein
MSTSSEPSTRDDKGLSDEEVVAFERDGYLIIPDALAPETVFSLLTETHRMLENFSLEDHPMTKFSAGETTEHVGDDYFLNSGDKIRFFFEEGECPPPNHAQASHMWQMHLTVPGTSPSPRRKPLTKSGTTSMVFLLLLLLCSPHLQRIHPVPSPAP